MPRRPQARHALLGALITVAVVALVAVLALDGGSGSPNPAAASAAGTAATPPAPSAGVPDDADPNLAPLPKGTPQVVQPQAGGDEQDELDAAGDNAAALPKPTGPASDTDPGRRRAEGTGGRPLRVDTATALDNGVALPPLEAPRQVLDVIRAGNTIARTPYKWGGGHGRFKDNGYDCSGSVSYALYFAGLIDKSYTSGELMRYGDPGKGRWITLYANAGHVYMEVAGIRFDTTGQRETGSRWQNDLRSGGGFVARHPPGF